MARLNTFTKIHSHITIQDPVEETCFRKFYQKINLLLPGMRVFFEGTCFVGVLKGHQQEGDPLSACPVCPVCAPVRRFRHQSLRSSSPLARARSMTERPCSSSIEFPIRGGRDQFAHGQQRWQELFGHGLQKLLLPRIVEVCAFNWEDEGVRSPIKQGL